MAGRTPDTQWDYELYPYDGSEIGLFLGQNISVNAGDVITILFYYVKMFTWAANYIYDGRNGGTGIGYFAANNQPQNEDVTITITVPHSGTIMFGNINGATTTNPGNSFRGKYIKILIN